MVEARELQRKVAALLRENGISSPIESQALMQLATQLSREEILMGAFVDDETQNNVLDIVSRRLQGEPLQYLIGRWPFLDFEVEVGSGVLIPRPETERLVFLAADFLKDRPCPAFLDLCTGTGCIAIGIARLVTHSVGTAVDISPQALVYAHRNVETLCPSLSVVQADLFGFEKSVSDESLDAIVCNPPYVTEEEYQENYDELRCEPKLALVASGDALGYYRYLASNYGRKLKSDGKIFLECSSITVQDVAKIFREAGWDTIQIFEDDFGLSRFVTAQRSC